MIQIRRMRQLGTVNCSGRNSICFKVYKKSKSPDHCSSSVNYNILILGLLLQLNLPLDKKIIQICKKHLPETNALYALHKRSAEQHSQLYLFDISFHSFNSIAGFFARLAFKGQGRRGDALQDHFTRGNISISIQF